MDLLGKPFLGGIFRAAVAAVRPGQPVRNALRLSCSACFRPLPFLKKWAFSRGISSAKAKNQVPTFLENGSAYQIHRRLADEGGGEGCFRRLIEVLRRSRRRKR